jgi:flagellin-like hook-associated protein FlgL
VLTVGAGANPLRIDINFTDSGAGLDQEEIQVSFAAGGYTLQEIVDAINLASNNPTQKYDENGNFLGYSAASIVETEDASGDPAYKLKLSARDSDVNGMTIDIGVAPTGAITGIFGTVNVLGTNLMADVGDVGGVDTLSLFQSWNGTAWVGDATGGADAGVNILDTTAAATALESITDAIGLKDIARAAFGYKINRLESTGEVLAIQTENLMTAESRISDVDVATEMAILTRNQVLAQAGTAMLAQANSIPQMALTLLR